MFRLLSQGAARCRIAPVLATMLALSAIPANAQAGERLGPIQFLGLEDSRYSTAWIAETQRAAALTATLSDEPAGSGDAVTSAVLAVGGALLGLALVDYVDEPPRHGLSASQSTLFGGAIVLLGWAGMRHGSAARDAASTGAPGGGAPSAAARIP